MSTEDPLGAEEVASKEFPVTFRGFGQYEVRSFLAQLAAELAAARERERLQRERLEAAEARAAERTPTGEEMEAALGHEASRLLHTAREAATEIRAKGEEEVARLVGEATSEAARIHQEAESLLGRRSEEAEKRAAEILAEAQRAAEAQVEEAKAEGREMVAEAQAVRERVLRDLVRRRRVAHQHLEQLRAARERLLEAYRVVRSTLDEATRELSVAEVEARAAAETAALRAAARPEPNVEELESELSAARDAGLTLARSDSGGSPAVDVNGKGREPEPQLEPELEPELEPAAEMPQREPEPEPEPVAEHEAPAQPAEPAETSGPVEELAPAELAEALAEVVEPAAQGEDQEQAAVVEVVEEDEPEAVEQSQPAPVRAPVGTPAADAARVAAAPTAAPHRAEPASPASDSDVEELFARIRADREAARMRAEAVLSESPPASDRAGMTATGEAGTDPANGHRPSEVVAEPAPPADDEHLLQERDAEIEPLERVLLRSFKRALADEQNEVLDALRRRRGRPTLADLLPAPGDHTARFLAVVSPDLEAGAAQGARDAGGQAPPVDDLARAFAAEVADDLQARLRRALEESDGDEAPLLEAISSAYREWKTARAQPLVRHHLAAAHARGRFAAAPAGPLRWVVDDDGGPCPDCDDNALAGPTPKGEPFPTGQVHPPAHVGCRCMVVAEPA